MTVSLAPVPLNLCDVPTVAAICDSLTVRCGVEQVCDGPLAYQLGRWQHITGRRACTDPQVAACEHAGCREPADPEQDCARGLGRCDGCCRQLDDELEGRRMWTR